MGQIPLLEIIFAIFTVIMRPDATSFTVVEGYSADDPITWTRLEQRSSWKAVSKKGVDHGVWRLSASKLTVTLEGATKTTDLNKYIHGDLDRTAPQKNMKVLGHKLQWIQKGDSFTLSTEDGGVLDVPVTAIKRSSLRGRR